MLRHTCPYSNNLEQLRKQAKELLDAWKTDDVDALARLRESHPRHESGNLDPSTLKLSDAQLVIARECAFPSWAQLKRSLDLGRTIRDQRDWALFGWRADNYYAREATELRRAHENRLRWAAAFLREHHPDFADLSNEQAFDRPLSEDDAKLAIAREAGFSDWAALSGQASTLGHETPDDADETIRAALNAVESGDADALDAVLERDPFVALASVRDNNTLLEVVTKSDAPFETRALIIRALVEHGAATGKALWTNDSLARDLLIELGALADGDEPALTALKSNLLHSARSAVDDWLQRGVKPVAFWMVASAGDLDGARAFFNEDGSLKPEAADHRPNFADIGWWEETGRSDDPREVLGEALCLAAMNGRLEVVKFLVEHGADVTFVPPGLGGWSPLDCAAHAAFPDPSVPRAEIVRYLLEQGADINRPDPHWNVTPLTWAVWRGNVALALELLERGASPDNVTTWGTTPLHYAAQNNELELTRALLEAGAPLDVKDNANDATPYDRVKGDEAKADVAALIRAYGSR